MRKNKQKQTCKTEKGEEKRRKSAQNSENTVKEQGKRKMKKTSATKREVRPKPLFKIIFAHKKILFLFKTQNFFSS